MADPKVAVVVTCYNLGKYLDEAVDSVLAQTVQDFEIVVVNDGSTDPDTVGLLTGYQRPRTRVIHIDNRGLSGARNEGIRQTTGKYVCCLDADDRLASNYIEKSMAVLDDNADVAFVSHWLETFGDETYVWKPSSAAFPALLDMNTINGAALVRRDALLAVGLFDETMRRGCEDWDLWISMVERGLPGVILPEVLFHYRQRRDSMSRVMMQGSTHVELYRYLIDKHRASFEAHALDLLLRREHDRSTLLAEAHDLELDCDAVLTPEIDRAREALRVIQHKVLSLEHRFEVGAGLQGAGASRDQMIAGLQEEISGLEAQRTRLAESLTGLEAELVRQRDLAMQLARVEDELLRNREGIEGLKSEIRMMRSSLSWRLTRPLRAVYSRLFE
jgi:GT2 family glycosyltransferase